MNKEEVWKDVPVYDGLYQVSSLGKIKVPPRWCKSKLGSRQLRNGKELVTRNMRDGYIQAGLTINGKWKGHPVHRLVASAFIPNPQNKPCVNHVDGNKKNNNVENLQWVTHKENTRHAILNDLIKRPKGESHSGSRLTKEKVIFIRQNLANMSGVEMAILFNVAPATIWRAKNKQCWNHV